MGDAIEIELSRGQAGLGFNIKGGIDIPHIEGDPGIFVAKIREKGAAAEDGRLQEGDKIIEINGNNVEKVQHKDAVGFFLNAGNSVKLKVIQGAEEQIKLKQYQSMNSNSAARPDNITSSNEDTSSSLGKILTVLGVGALLVAVYIGWRHRRS